MGESPHIQIENFPNETFSCLMASPNFSLLILKIFLKEMLFHIIEH